METQSIDDTELLGRLGRGDADALATLHHEHAKPVYWAAYRVLRSYSDADEITQDAFVTLWRKRRSIVVYGASALPWLLTTAKYLALNRRRELTRKSQNETGLFEIDLAADADPSTSAAEAEETAALREAVSRLSSPDREIVILCLVHGLTYKEAAVRLRLTHAGVRNRLSRARIQLRSDLTAPNGGE